jgi:hypothetical protein
LKKTARWFRIAGKDITELAQMPIDELHAHMHGVAWKAR